MLNLQFKTANIPLFYIVFVTRLTYCINMYSSKLKQSRLQFWFRIADLWWKQETKWLTMQMGGCIFRWIIIIYTHSNEDHLLVMIKWQEWLWIKLIKIFVRFGRKCSNRDFRQTLYFRRLLNLMYYLKLSFYCMDKACN